MAQFRVTEKTMSFITLEKMQRGGGRAPGEGRAYASFSKPASTGGKIYISSKLAEQLGWKAKDRVAVAMGTGADFGTLRLVASKTGYALSNVGGTSSKALSICFNHFNDVVKTFTRTEMRHSIAGGALYARLPELLITAKAETVTEAPYFASVSNSG